MLNAARMIGETYGCAVLLKGGHRQDDANDLLYANGAFQWYRSIRVQNSNTHGTGCTLSSAIAASLAKGYPLPEAIRHAKVYTIAAIANSLDLGKGSDPLNHMHSLTMRLP